MLLLIITDGWGVNPNENGNAITAANPQCYKRLLETCPKTTLQPGGEAVGLPVGQMGNSEVGHLNIGAGRVVYQDLPKISRDMDNGNFAKIPEIQEFIAKAKKGGKVHLMGLMSDGGVHSHLEHIKGFIKICKQEGIEKLYVHAYMDGRDTSPVSGKGYLTDLENCMQKTGLGKIATISGRFYAMDRDQRWERVQKAYDTIVRGKGNTAASMEECMTKTYADKVTDEFIIPTVIEKDGLIEKNDHVFFMNFRPDRAREMSFALTDKNFDSFDVEKDLDLNYITMTPYSEELNVPIVYKKENLPNTFSELLSRKGLKQLKIAETEKYAHVTYFLNGGREEPFKGEDRILVPSPKVETYDLQPEMSAFEVCGKLVAAIHSQKYDVMVVNFANPDMVGHTGVFDAAVKAIKVVDGCVEKLLDAMAAHNGATFITADHGNSDEMVDDKTGDVLTNHSLKPVDLIFVPAKNDTRKYNFTGEGKLADIVPTVLTYMGIDLAEEMDGHNLMKVE